MLDTLIDARLLTSYEIPEREGRTSQQRIEIVHESLLANWPRLVRWQMQDAEGAKLRDEIRSQARLWEEHGRSEDYLWTGAAFKEYELWRERYRGGLSETERAFCEAMVAHARKQKRLFRIAVAASFGILVMTLAVVTTLWRQGEAARREAVAEARRAEANQLVALAHLEVDQYPTAALAYAISSLELADALTTRIFALEVLWRGPTAFILDDHFSWNAQFSPDGRWLASGGTRGRLAVWPSVGGRAIALRGQEGNAVPIGFTSDSTHLVTQGKRAEETLRVWSLEPPQLTKTWTVDRVSEWAAFFDSTQQRILTYEINAESSGAKVRSWPIFEGEPRLLETVPKPVYWNAWCSDPTTSRIGFSPYASGVVHVASLSEAALGSAPTLGQHELPVVGCAFQAGGRRVATIDESGSVDIWFPESTNGHPERVLTTPGNISARSIALSPEGSLLAVGSTDQTLRIWDLSASPAADALHLRRGDVGFILGLGFDPSGRWLAAGTASGTAIWPVGGSFSQILSGHTDVPAALEFTTDGSYLLSASYDGSIRRWPLGPEVSAQADTLFQDPSGIELLELDPRGGRAVFSTSDGGPILTSFDERSFAWMAGMEFSFSALAFDPGGRWVAAGGGAIEQADALIRLWDVDSPEARLDKFHQMPVMDYSLTLDAGDGEEISDLAFAPSGWLFSAGSGGLRRWSVVEKSFEQIIDEPVLQLAISSDERWLFGITGDRRLAAGGRILRIDLHDFTAEYLGSHGGEVLSMALSTEGDILVTGDSNGIVRVGRPDGLQPHLLLGHAGPIRAVAVSIDRRWIGSGSDDNTLRLWPMPDLDKAPLHTLPQDELVAKLKSLTNLRAVRDPESSSGWSIEVGPFPGWEEVPTW